MPVNRLQSHDTAPDTLRVSGRTFVAFDVPLPRAGAKPPEIMRALLHHIGMTDADIARFSQQKGYDLVDHSVTALQKYGGFQTASVHVTREHPQGLARLEIPRADYDALRHFINGSDMNAMPDSTARSARAGGEAYAAHRGINTTAQVRAQLDAKLPVSKTTTPQVTSSSTAKPVAHTKPVTQMTTTEKLQFAVERAAAHLAPAAAEKLRQLVTPENLAIMAGTTAALIAVQGVPVLDVLVDASIAGVAVYALGGEAIGVIKDLAGFASGVLNAKTESDLDAAGQHMARAVSTVGVDAVAAVLLHKAGGAIKERMPPPPAMREMVTPEGLRVRVPMEGSPVRANVAKMTAEGEGSGSTPPSIRKVKVGDIELPATTELSIKDKLFNYLLNPDHPKGGPKAKWFKEALGFTKGNMDEFSGQLVFDPAKAVQTEATKFGVKYNQTTPITGANGRKIDVLVSWIRNEDGIIRLVTAVPTKKGGYMFKDYDVVALKHDLPSENLRAGDTGTVLMVYSASPPTYEVEFTDEDGATLALLTLEDGNLIAAPAPQLRKQAV